MKRNMKSVIAIYLMFTLSSSAFAQTNRLLQAPMLLNDKAEEIKVALIGDTEAGTNFGTVLKMIAAEKANVVMINGDFGYGDSPTTWKNRVLASVDPDTLPIIGTLGNHDVGNNTNIYISILNSFRTAKNGLLTSCTGKSGISEGHDITAVDEVCTFGNVSIIGSGIGQVLSKTYLENRLEVKLKNVPADNWKLVGYHFTLASMNPGIKGDESSQKFFDIIRQNGAIGAQGHTHVAMASCPIISTFKKGSPIQCHPSFTNPEERFVTPGTGMYVDSSLGGKEARTRQRCKNPTDVGCRHMVDIISGEGYTRTDGVRKTNFNRFGAMFFVFNVGGDASKAFAYFKSIDGQIIFKFDLVR